MNLDAALAYAERHRLDAFVALRGEEIVAERFGEGWNAERPHPLYSGTKSFWGVLAVLAEADGLLTLDEPVGATIPAWAQDAAKRRVTLRMLLQLTSGIGFGGLGSAVPTYERALAVELRDPPGTTFTYGGIPLQVFGAVLARKLAPREMTPHRYLRERLFTPIGLEVAQWRTLRDGTHPLPTGAFLAARAWLKYGQLVRDGGLWRSATVVPRELLAACFVGSEPNPRYGLGWWLSPLAHRPDIVYASGAGGQALYVLPADDLVVVKYGQSNSYDHAAFLRRLTG